MVRFERCFSHTILCAALLVLLVRGEEGASSTSPPMPRSNQPPIQPLEVTRYPPWSPSSKIDENGFLIQQYRRVPGEWEQDFKVNKRHQLEIQIPTTIRQVPGDGNCLFHSISTCYSHAVNGTHVNLRSPESIEWLYENSSKLRRQAVDCLEEQRKLLFLQGHEYIRAQDLVEAASSQYKISPEEYCQLMRQDGYWGGGPEIVALCNVLRRPIHVYELLDEGNKFVLRRMACFGSPKFDRNSVLHILSADSRFPDLSPGRQLAAGNHFLSMFPTPVDDDELRKLKKKRKRENRQKLRGGDDRPHRLKGHINSNDDFDHDFDGDEQLGLKDNSSKMRSFFRPSHWLSRLWIPSQASFLSKKKWG